MTDELRKILECWHNSDGPEIVDKFRSTVAEIDRLTAALAAAEAERDRLRKEAIETGRRLDELIVEVRDLDKAVARAVTARIARSQETPDAQ